MSVVARSDRSSGFETAIIIAEALAIALFVGAVGLIIVLGKNR